MAHQVLTLLSAQSLSDSNFPEGANVPEDKRTRLICVIGIERAFPETMSPA